MNARFTATGLNATPRWLWVYYIDRRLAVPRPMAVQVGWGLVVPEYQDICHGINNEITRRHEAEAKVAQLPLPLEAWE